MRESPETVGSVSAVTAEPLCFGGNFQTFVVTKSTAGVSSKRDKRSTLRKSGRGRAGAWDDDDTSTWMRFLVLTNYNLFLFCSVLNFWSDSVAWIWDTDATTFHDLWLFELFRFRVYAAATILDAKQICQKLQRNNQRRRQRLQSFSCHLFLVFPDNIMSTTF